MWVFTTGGFVSAVEHRDNKDLLMIRARDRQSLDTMIEGIELAGNAINADGEKLAVEKDLEPKASDNADYRWRVVISKATFALWLQFEVLNYLNYPNFKSALGKHRGADFTSAAHRVWDDMQLVSDGTQVYGGVGVGGKRIAKAYSNYGTGSSYYGGGYGSYGYGGKSESTYPASSKKWQGSKYPAAGEVGSTFFENEVEGDAEWGKGYHGFNDVRDAGIEDADIIETYALDGEDVPEIPVGAEDWTEEEFENWLDTGDLPGGQAAVLEEETPLFKEPETKTRRLNYDEAKAELKALTAGSSRPTFREKKKARRAAKNAAK